METEYEDFSVLSLEEEKEIRGSKKVLRSRIKKAMKLLSPAERAEEDACIAKHIITSPVFKQAEIILAYLAFGEEISVDEVIREALLQGKKVAVPLIVSSDEFKAALLTGLDDLPLDRYGIRTVNEEGAVFIEADVIDLVLVPGLGFSSDGRRIGRGAGYYDRYLAECGGVQMGIARTRLMSEEIPVETFDIRVDAVATEKGIIYCSEKNN